MEISEKFLGVLEAAGKPLTAAELRRRGGQGVEVSACESAICELLRRDALHRWSKQRFWLEDEFAVLEKEARKLIRTKPLWKSILSNKLAKTRWDSPRAKLDAVFGRLKKSPAVHTWPRFGRLQGDSLCLKEIDLSFYLGKLRKDYDLLARKLTRAGVPPDAIAAAICQKASGDSHAAPKNGGKRRQPKPAAAPGGEAEEDFQRDVCEQLVFAWRESGSDETRQSLEQAMFNTGLRRFGNPGEEVGFDGLAHESADLLLPGEKAIIEAPGWKLDRRGRTRVLIKAKIKG